MMRTIKCTTRNERFGAMAVVARRTLLLLCMSLFFFSCKSERKSRETVEKTENRIQVIDIEKAMKNLSNQPFNFSEFVEDIIYTPLQTTPQSVVGGRRPPPLNVSENYIFYGDMMFGRDGRFIRKLGKIGQGPEEYILALGISVDEERQEFYVYDNYNANIYVYDFDNRFRRKIQAPDRGGSILSLGKGKIVLLRDFYGYFNDFYEYSVIDTDSEEISFSRNSGITDNGLIRNFSNSLWNYNQKTSYYEASTDTIFYLNKNGEIKIPRYLIYRGKYKKSENETFLKLSGFVESDKFLFFNITKTTEITGVNRPRIELYYGVYNKQTGEIIINKFDVFFNNDIDGGFLWLFNSTADGNEGYYDVFPYLAKERIEALSKQNKGYDKEKNQKLRQLIDKVKEEDNTIFYFFKLK